MGIGGQLLSVTSRGGNMKKNIGWAVAAATAAVGVSVMAYAYASAGLGDLPSWAYLNPEGLTGSPEAAIASKVQESQVADSDSTAKDLPEPDQLKNTAAIDIPVLTAEEKKQLNQQRSAKNQGNGPAGGQEVAGKSPEHCKYLDIPRKEHPVAYGLCDRKTGKRQQANVTVGGSTADTLSRAVNRSLTFVTGGDFAGTFDVSLEDGFAKVNFKKEFKSKLLSNAQGLETWTVDRAINETIFSVSSTKGARFTLDGDCLKYAVLMGDDLCTTETFAQILRADGLAE